MGEGQNAIMWSTVCFFPLKSQLDKNNHSLVHHQAEQPKAIKPAPRWYGIESVILSLAEQTFEIYLCSMKLVCCTLSSTFGLPSALHWYLTCINRATVPAQQMRKGCFLRLMSYWGQI